jgi:uncharacterized protein YyaL (SSP411 family)
LAYIDDQTYLFTEALLERYMNRLSKEKSPYLLQHADNPVDWYPWGEEAFEKARQESKPVFLSIGYATCHWCHVMEHESFEDSEVAELMNEAFVCVKVDREERPDIDNIYMNVCQMLTGAGGWPLTIFLTPDKEPFFAGTYIPKHDRFGRPGMLAMIPRIQELWKLKQQDVIRSASEITQGLSRVIPQSPGDVLDEASLKLGYEQLSRRFDRVYGGFGDAPKFPTPHQYMFLLRYWKRTGDPRALEMVEKSLHAMRQGGIYDHIGYGFHRYSTDREWLVPHFEKMLYDQALLSMTYIEAFQATREEEYALIAREIYQYVLRDMTHSGGGFYSAEDADSEGVEGKFYVWKAEELEQILGEEAPFFFEVFNIERHGNFIEQVVGHRTGDNIIYRTKPWGVLGSENKMEEQLLRLRIEACRKKLFEEREQRVHPLKDDKILTDWNGLMIASFAKAAAALAEPKFAEAAANAAHFILQQMRAEDGGLLHRFRDGDAAIPGNLDDYAFMVWGLLELYQTGFDVSFLRHAIELNDYALAHFWDDRTGGFFFTGDTGEKLLIRTKEIYDGAVPSGNSVAYWNLLRLARLTGKAELEGKAEYLERIFSPQVTQIPSAHAQFLIGLDFRIGPSYEVVIAGRSETSDTAEMLVALQKIYAPNKILVFRPEGDTQIAEIAPFTESQNSIEGKATAYICQNRVCNLPTTNIRTAIDQIT